MVSCPATRCRRRTPTSFGCLCPAGPRSSRATRRPWRRNRRLPPLALPGAGWWPRRGLAGGRDCSQREPAALGVEVDLPAVAPARGDHVGGQGIGHIYIRPATPRLNGKSSDHTASTQKSSTDSSAVSSKTTPACSTRNSGSGRTTTTTAHPRAGPAAIHRTKDCYKKTKPSLPPSVTHLGSSRVVLSSFANEAVNETCHRRGTFRRRVVVDTGDNVQSTIRHCPMCRACVLDGDDPILITADDQCGQKCIER